jgi:hypothetical protein
VSWLGKFTTLPHLSIEPNFSFSLATKSWKAISEMDDKVLSSVGDLELADQGGGAIPNSDVGGNMTRDEGEMAFYGKKAQLKVRVLNGLNVAMSRD